MISTPTAPGSAPELLASVRAAADDIATAEIRQLVAIRDWALAHTVEASDPDVATLFAGRDDTGLPLAGRARHWSPSMRCSNSALLSATPPTPAAPG